LVCIVVAEPLGQVILCFMYFFLLTTRTRRLFLLCLIEAETLMKSSGFMQLDHLTKILSLKMET